MRKIILKVVIVARAVQTTMVPKSTCLRNSSCSIFAMVRLERDTVNAMEFGMIRCEALASCSAP